jgi:hypothetical protein
MLVYEKVQKKFGALDKSQLIEIIYKYMRQADQQNEIEKQIKEIMK